MSIGKVTKRDKHGNLMYGSNVYNKIENVLYDVEKDIYVYCDDEYLKYGFEKFLMELGFYKREVFGGNCNYIHISLDLGFFIDSDNGADKEYKYLNQEWDEIQILIKDYISEYPIKQVTNHKSDLDGTGGKSIVDRLSEGVEKIRQKITDAIEIGDEDLMEGILLGINNVCEGVTDNGVNANGVSDNGGDANGSNSILKPLVGNLPTPRTFYSSDVPTDIVIVGACGDDSGRQVEMTDDFCDFSIVVGDEEIDYPLESHGFVSVYTVDEFEEFKKECADADYTLDGCDAVYIEQFSGNIGTVARDVEGKLYNSHDDSDYILHQYDESEVEVAEVLVVFEKEYSMLLLEDMEIPRNILRARTIRDLIGDE